MGPAPYVVRARGMARSDLGTAKMRPPQDGVACSKRGPIAGLYPPFWANQRANQRQGRGLGDRLSVSGSAAQGVFLDVNDFEMQLTSNWR